MPSAAFIQSLPFILRWEGSFVNNPADPGARPTSVADCKQIDGLITVGSPSGLDEVQDFRKNGAAAIEDIAVRNDGSWRHSATKHFRQPFFCSELRRMFREQGEKP
jgi:hypothetical protein